MDMSTLLQHAVLNEKVWTTSFTIGAEECRIEILQFAGESPERPLLEVAARQAFWQLTQSFLVNLHSHVCADLPTPPDLIGLLLDLIRKTLGKKTSNDEIVRILKLRLVNYESDLHQISELLGFEYLMDGIDEKEQERVKSEIQSGKALVEDIKQLEVDIWDWEAFLALTQYVLHTISRSIIASGGVVDFDVASRVQVVHGL